MSQGILQCDNILRVLNFAHLLSVCKVEALSSHLSLGGEYCKSIAGKDGVMPPGGCILTTGTLFTSLSAEITEKKLSSVLKCTGQTEKQQKLLKQAWCDHVSLLTAEFCTVCRLSREFSIKTSKGRIEYFSCD